MNLKTIIILIAAGLISFAGFFGVFYFLNMRAHEKDVNSETADVAQQDISGDGYEHPIENFTIKTTHATNPADSLTEKQLKNLIIDLKEKRREYQRKEDELIEKEERLKITQETIKKDIERLESIKQELISAIADYKIEKKELDDSVLKIETVEKENLTWRAAVYDKMDATSAAKIFINMAANNQIDDSAKIIHYMSERNAAKLLAEIANTQPTVTSAINIRLKSIKEQQ